MVATKGRFPTGDGLNDIGLSRRHLQRALDDFVRAGKVRYVGLSNYTGRQVQKTVALARARGWAPPVTLQPQYSLLVRKLEWEIVPFCLDAGLGLLPWSPLGGGWPTDKYSRDVGVHQRGRTVDPAEWQAAVPQ